MIVLVYSMRCPYLQGMAEVNGVRRPYIEEKSSAPDPFHYLHICYFVRTAASAPMRNAESIGTHSHDVDPGLKEMCHRNQIPSIVTRQIRTDTEPGHHTDPPLSTFPMYRVVDINSSTATRGPRTFFRQFQALVQAPVPRFAEAAQSSHHSNLIQA